MAQACPHFHHLPMCYRVCENGSYLHKIQVYLFILSYLSLFLCGLHNISKFYWKFCVYEYIIDKVATMLGKELLNLKGSKLGQILRADKTGFRRLSHIILYQMHNKLFRAGLQS